MVDSKSSDSLVIIAMLIMISSLNLLMKFTKNV